MIHILFWNPDISSMTCKRMENEMPEIIHEGGCFNWSFWEHDNVHPGDECYLVRCSDKSGRHGVVLRGKIISEPYISEDWSGKGRTIYYADWYPQEFIDSEWAEPLSPEELERAMPDFNWYGGHSGRPLPEEYGPVLEKMWYEHISKLIPEIDDELIDDELYVNPRKDEITSSTLEFLKKIGPSDCLEPDDHFKIAISDCSVGWEKVTISANDIKIEFDASELGSEPLTDLINALSDLEGCSPYTINILWTSEPGELRLRLKRDFKNGFVKISIKETDDENDIENAQITTHF